MWDMRNYLLGLAVALWPMIVSGEHPSQRNRPDRPDRLVFARDVLPILSNHCFQCHGPDAKDRQAGLRLDDRHSALSLLESGQRAVVPGDTSASELVTRIGSSDPESMMPPKSSLKPLQEFQRRVLIRWIEEGAEYQSHWAFNPPRLPPIPDVSKQAWTRSPIDQFVMARWDRENLAPSPAATRATILRRLSFDLQGLPPSLEDLEELPNDFDQPLVEADPVPDIWERVTDRYLASPRFGERLAMIWLDAARFADTNGYNNDEDRLMWRWRDWVIEALNHDLPYDQFLVEQLAGDMLVNPTLEQRLATGFNRNHVLTTEGGIIDEEYRIEYVADRVQTTASVFMGLTLQCARCHDHKFDPISQLEYYQLFAFFNHSPDKLLGYNKGAPATPFIKVPTRLQQEELAQIALHENDLKQQLAGRELQAIAECDAWERLLSADDRQRIAAPAGLALHFAFDEVAGDQARDVVSGKLLGRLVGPARWDLGKHGNALQTDESSFLEAGDEGRFDRNERVSWGAWVRRSSDASTTVISRMHDSAAYRGYDLNVENDRLAVHLIHHWPDNAIKVSTKGVVSKDQWHHLLVTYDGSSRAAGIKIFVDGKLQEMEINNDTLSDTIATDRPFHVGRRGEGNGFRGSIDDVQFYRSELTAEDVAELAAGRRIAGLEQVLAAPREARTAEQQQRLLRYFIDQVDPHAQRLRDTSTAIAKQRVALETTVPTSLVMEDLAERRTTHLLVRGQYDQPSTVVEASVPRALSAPDSQLPPDRLGLARWLTSATHPLTARVAVNRWWATIWSTGLVETAEDFGVQGAWPSHPELLDWLAVTYRNPSFGGESNGAPAPRGWGWSTKSMLRMMVLSAAYRQTSDASPGLRDRDPQNRLLTRAARMRLPAEMLRDGALAASGALVERQGGPSVMPYQPAGLWEDVSVERRVTYKPDSGAGLYRRSFYTFWKRTCPPPGMTTFDAPDREFCVIRRARTNTPLQALVLLNDTTYVEAARKLAERVLHDGGAQWDTRLDLAMQRAVSRRPQAEERRILRNLFENALNRFRNDPAAAEKLLAVGASSGAGAEDLPVLAAWTTVASVLINLDEAMTRE